VEVPALVAREPEAVEAVEEDITEGQISPVKMARFIWEVEEEPEATHRDILMDGEVILVVLEVDREEPEAE
jgi:hypothetical protein